MTDFQEVYNLYFRDVYRFALSLCRNESIAEEITQETFYKALEKLDSFDGKCKVSVWLCQIAKNLYYSHCRKEKKQDNSLIESGIDFVLTIDDKEQTVVDAVKAAGLEVLEVTYQGEWVSVTARK